MQIRHPPGRSGRVWLRVRRDVADGAIALLEQKERVLLREQQRLRVLVRRSRGAWDEACRDAQMWSARAASLGGSDVFVFAAPADVATADLHWRNSMGAYYPYEASCGLPKNAFPGTRSGTAATSEAVRATRDATVRAVEFAAAQRAADEVERELVATRRRLRMLRNRWIPAIDDAIRELEVSLEERERDDVARAHWANGSRGGSS